MPKLPRPTLNLHLSELKPKVRQSSVLQENTDGKMLFCFDWDQTIVKGHMQKHLFSKLYPNGNLIGYVDLNDDERNTIVEDFLKDEETGWNNKELIVELFKIIIDLGHKIAVVSFGSYPKQIEHALSQLDPEIKDIYIVSEPVSDNTISKLSHIEKAMSHFGFSRSEQVVLIDDDSNNVMLAEEGGIKAIQVKVDNTQYIDKLCELIGTTKLTRPSLSELGQKPHNSTSTTSTDSGISLTFLIEEDQELTGDCIDFVE